MKTFIQFLLEQAGPGGAAGGTGLTLPSGQGITAMSHPPAVAGGGKTALTTNAGAYYAGTVLGTPAPAEEFAGALSGSVASTGYTEAGAKARFNMYKSVTDLGAGLVGRGLGMGGAAVGSFGGLLAATAVGGALRGASNETAKIMTAALYDPRAAGALSQLEPLGISAGTANYQGGPSITGP